jgi:spore germination protein
MLQVEALGTTRKETQFMYKRLSAILFPIAFFALVGAGIWGYQENQEKNTILMKAENQYQRAFHDLNYHVDKLHTELGNAITVNSTSQDFYKKGLVNVWRLSSQAQNEINQLPLTLLPFNETKQFLNNISQFSYRTAVRDLSTKPITQSEMSTLNTLFERSKSIRDQLQGVQNKVLAKNLRWMDVEVAIASQKNNQDNAIVDGFRTVDKKVGESTEMNWGPSMMGVVQKRKLTMLSGNDQSPDQIKQKAAQFLRLKNSSGLLVAENGAGTDHSSYSVAAHLPNHPEGVHLDLAKKGGEVLYYSAPRTIPNKVIDMAAARQAASEFLEQHGYKQMKAVSYDESHNEASIEFARQQNTVIIYPEKLTVRVAMNNGEITGLQALDYVYEHKDRKWNAPTITVDQAKKELNSKFQLSSNALALIKNDMDEEVLCHQLIGRINGNTYKIMVNANTGFEESIEVLRPQAAQV